MCNSLDSQLRTANRRSNKRSETNPVSKIFLHSTAPLILVALACPASAQTAPAQSTRTRAQVAQQLDAKFKTFDSNRDGRLSKAEIQAAETRAQQQAAARIAQRTEQSFARLDKDKNGQLSLVEFKAAAPPVRGITADTLLQRLDSNTDGAVTLQEFGARTLAAFDRMDRNRDGTLSAAERQAALGPPVPASR